MIPALAALLALAWPQESPLPPEHLAGLEEGARLRREIAVAKGADKAKLEADFAAALRKVAPLLPEVKALDGAAAGPYAKLALNRGGKGLDAFRFTTPAGAKAWDLDWEFVYAADSNLSGWYILALEGDVRGFRSFKKADDHREDGADLPERNRRITQQLPPGALKPESGYLIWFSFKDAAPADVHVRLRLAPAK